MVHVNSNGSYNHMVYKTCPLSFVTNGLYNLLMVEQWLNIYRLFIGTYVLA